MSVMALEDHHFNTIVSWVATAPSGATVSFRAKRGWVNMAQNMAEAASEMCRANLLAYDQRYPQEATGIDDEPLVFIFQEKAKDLTPVQIIKACNCVEYQCEQWGDWHESVAYYVLRSIKEHAIKQLDGYEKAAWEIRS